MSGGRPDGSKAFTDAAGDTIGSHFFGQSSFASHSVVARTSVVKVDPSYDLTLLGPLGCGIQTGAGAILNTLDVQPGSSVVVTGAGALGLSAVMAAKVAGAETIIAIDRHANRLELAEKYGATTTLSGDPAELTAGIHAATGGGADYAFDTTGNAAVVRASFEGLNNLGTIGLAGVGFGDLTFDFLSLIGGSHDHRRDGGRLHAQRVHPPARAAQRRRRVPVPRTRHHVLDRPDQRGRGGERRRLGDQAGTRVLTPGSARQAEAVSDARKREVGRSQGVLVDLDRDHVVARLDQPRVDVERPVYSLRRAIDRAGAAVCQLTGPSGMLNRAASTPLT